MVVSFVGVTSAQFLRPPVHATANYEIPDFSERTFFQPHESEHMVIPGLDAQSPNTPTHKSGFLAGALSAVLPGLGEYYVGDQIWRGIIFTAIDAGLWFERYHYISKGDDAYSSFQKYSDTYWSSKLYSDTLNFLLGRAGKQYRISDSNDFSQINRAEDSLREFFPNLTHNLPARGSQQYYELISKYIQFTGGWRDNLDGIPEHSAEYQKAAFMREDMNHQYEVADDFLYGLILNRVLSVIDAVLLARDHNTPIHLEGELQRARYRDGTMGFMPTAKLTFRF
ncbi:MAG: hypothetical protein WCH46_05395 [bacterium]